MKQGKINRVGVGMDDSFERDTNDASFINCKPKDKTKWFFLNFVYACFSDGSVTL